MNSLIRPFSIRRTMLAIVGLCSAWVMVNAPAYAVPSFARQTGAACSACHVGSFGPQLTPFGMNFKMSGYTLSMGQNNVPISAMMISSMSNIQKAQSDGTPQANGQPAEQISLFFAGRVAEEIGAFIQATSSSGSNLGMDNVDIRYAKQTTLADMPAIVGVSLNNNPTGSDPFNTLPAWGQPYVGGGGRVTPSSTMLDGGLSAQTMGINVYTFLNSAWYAELGAYTSLSRKFLENVNTLPANSASLAQDPYKSTNGISPYWRLARMGNVGSATYTAGVFGMDTQVTLPNAPGLTDKYTDVGVDASLILQRDNSDAFTIASSLTNETQKLDASGWGSNNLQKFNLHSAYYFHDTYGLTAGMSKTSGSPNTNAYAAYDPTNPTDTGSLANVPDTDSYMLQADWTPFGKSDSWGAPFANLRLGAQYTMFTKFNGATNNYDGNGRNASDNNTLYFFVWSAI